MLKEIEKMPSAVFSDGLTSLFNMKCFLSQCKKSLTFSFATTHYKYLAFTICLKFISRYMEKKL
jgi:hypothetical protein